MGKVLVIAAHADDEVLGAGGTIAKHAGLGDEVYALFLTSPASQVHGNGDLLEKECRKATAILGIQDFSSWDFPDQLLDTIPQHDLIQVIETEIKKFEPDIVYTHSPNDVNADHRAVHAAALVACRPWRSSVKHIRLFPIPGNNYHQPFAFNEVEDITQTIDLKLKALRTYKSELDCWPPNDPKRPENVWALAKLNAWCMDYEFAEQFWTIGREE